MMLKPKEVISLSIEALLRIILLLLFVAFITAVNIKGTVKAALPKLDLLNQDAIAQIPHAPGLQWINAGRLILTPENDGGSPFPSFEKRYTVWHAARYRVIYTSNGPIVDYYKKYFHDQGWRQYKHIEPSKKSRIDYYQFYQGATCAALIFDPEDATLNLGYFNSLTIRVWHDFWKSNMDLFDPLGFAELLVQVRYELPKCPL